MYRLNDSERMCLSARCRKLFDVIGAHSLIILEAAPELIRNGDVHYPYRQYSDMLYLTDCPEPHTRYLIYLEQGRLHRVMACRTADPSMAQWTGEWTTPTSACEQYGVEESIALDDWPARLHQQLQHTTDVFLINTSAVDAFKKIYPTFQGNHHTLDTLLAPFRMLKDELAYNRMKQAASLSAQAHQQVMQHCQSNWTEAQIEGAFFATGRTQGGTALAYPTIAAGGAHACVLHYTDNQAFIEEGALVLLDAGMEYQGYAADITRTFPINGTFSTEQRQIYSLVLSAQTAAIDAIRPGVTWDELESLTQQILIEGLLDLGILKGSIDTLREHQSLRRFYPHRLGHHLGLDVHDVTSKNANTQPFQAGYMVTIEPGLYFKADDDLIAQQWRGIGVRIEDDVYVTPSGCEVLSHTAPKTIEAIEAMMHS